MSDDVAVSAFWMSALLIAYGYVGYPLVIYIFSQFKIHPVNRKDILPTVSLIVPAYNEAHVIEEKIENCWKLDYPKEQLEILIASDGSTDGTSELIQKATNDGRIGGLVYPCRRGKAAVVNDLVRAASGQIIVFSDAASMLEASSLRRLVSNFADPEVGCVSGVYCVTKDGNNSDAEQENSYWRYETFIRLSESRLGTMLGAHGSMHGVRRELFEPLAPGVINDDFLIPMTILLKGFRCIYDTRALAWEAAKEMAGFSRRIRIMMGNYQQVFLLLNNTTWLRRPGLLLQFLSHKVLRLGIPFFLIILYVSNASLLAYPVYRAAFLAQTLFYAAALLGRNTQWRMAGKTALAAPYYFCMLNMAAIVAVFRILRRKDNVVWKTE